MKTLVIGYGHQKDDKRVSRSVSALKKLGPVHYQFWRTAADERSEQRGNGVILHPLSRDQMRGFGKYAKRLNFDREVLRLVSELDYDLVVFHFSPAFFPVKVFAEAKKRKKKIIYDLHEIMPEQRLPEKAGLLKPFLWTILKTQFSLSDGVISVSQEAIDYMFKKTKFFQKYHVVPNYSTKCIKPIILEQRKREIIVIGGSQRKVLVSPILTSLLKANFTLISIGMNWSDADENLLAMGYNSMMKRISEACFSLISFCSRSNPDYKNDIYSLPHKLYDSLAAGTPVLLAQRFISMKALVERTNSGLVLDFARDPIRDLDTVNDSLRTYGELLRGIENNCREFVWDAEKETALLNFIEKVVLR